MTQYASIEIKTAYMSDDFAISYATRLFGAEAVAALPKISRGKRKGATKGLLCWKKATVGGWHRDGIGGGHVVYPGFIRAWLEIDGKTVLETDYASHDKKLAAEAEALRHQAYVKAQAEAEFAEERAERFMADRIAALIAAGDIEGAKALAATY